MATSERPAEPRRGTDLWPLGLHRDYPITLALVMAVTGRAAYCEELDGDGVAVLRDRATGVTT